VTGQPVAATATAIAATAAPLLAIDTATSTAVLALGARDGTLLAADTWEAGHRHAEELLARIAALLGAAGIGAPGRESWREWSSGPGREASPASGWGLRRPGGSRGRAAHR
jgi:hypothetical protein